MKRIAHYPAAAAAVIVLAACSSQPNTASENTTPQPTSQAQSTTWTATPTPSTPWPSNDTSLPVPSSVSAYPPTVDGYSQASPSGSTTTQPAEEIAIKYLTEVGAGDAVIDPNANAGRVRAAFAYGTPELQQQVRDTPTILNADISDQWQHKRTRKARTAVSIRVTDMGTASTPLEQQVIIQFSVEWRGGDNGLPIGEPFSALMAVDLTRQTTNDPWKVAGSSPIN